MKKKRWVFLISFLLLFLMSMGASSLARVYQVDDPILQDIDRLSLESGINSFTPSAMVSGYELAQHMDLIDRNALSEDSKQLFDSVMTSLKDPFDGKLVDYSIDITQELYANTNADTEYYEWVEGYTDRAPLLYGEVETIFGNSYGFFSYALEKAFSETDFSSFATNNMLLFNGGNSAVQNSQPNTAFLGVAGDWFTLAMGRDALSYGRGNTGNLMIGSHVPYHDFVQAKVYNPKIRYSFLTIPMNELITADMNVADQGPGEAWYPHWDGEDESTIDDWHTLFYGTLRRIYISHRVEMDILPTWRFAVTEGSLYYVDTLDIRMFSPLMFLHNLQDFGEVNSSLGIESEITLSKHWMLDIQLFLDQIQTPGEADSVDPLPPNANALLIGARYQYPLNGWHLKGFIEGAYTSPFAYLRAGDATANYGGDAETQYNLDFVNAVSMEEGKSGVDWLGYVYGPDSIVLAAGAELSDADRYSFTSDIRFIVQGEYRGLKIEGGIQQVELQLPANINMLSPSGGNPLYTTVLGLGGRVFLLDRALQFYSRNYWVHSWDDSNVSDDFQMLFGARYSF